MYYIGGVLPTIIATTTETMDKAREADSETVNMAVKSVRFAHDDVARIGKAAQRRGTTFGAYVREAAAEKADADLSEPAQAA